MDPIIIIPGTTEPTPIAITPGGAGAQGPQGEPGPAGADGAQGVQGVQGIQGPKGDAGIQGIQGPAGAQGIQGPKGDTGVDGIQGIQGMAGTKGDKGDTGLQGIQGIQGPKGDTGPQGIQGPPGADGTGGGSTLLTTYEYIGNPEARVESINTATNTITATGHPFVNGDTIFPSMYIDGFNLATGIPTGITQAHYFVISATANTFQISLTAGGTAVAITTTTNANLVVFQKAMIKAASITGLASMTKCFIRAMIYASLDDKGQGIALIPAGWAKSGDLAPNPVSAALYSLGRVGARGTFIQATFDGSHRRKTVSGSYVAMYGDITTTPATAAENRISQMGNAASWPFTGIDIGFYNGVIYLANRSIVEVYSV